MQVKNLIIPLKKTINFSLTDAFYSQANHYIAICHYVILVPDEKEKIKFK